MNTDQPAAMRSEWPDPPGPDANFDEIKAYAQTMMMADFILSVAANDVDLPEESRPTAQQAWAMAENHLRPKPPTLNLEQPFDRAFAVAKETCRDGYLFVGDGGGCSYGGMSPAYGYWLSDENCTLNHGDTCDLRAACDGYTHTFNLPPTEYDEDGEPLPLRIVPSMTVERIAYSRTEAQPSSTDLHLLLLDRDIDRSLA